MDASPPARRQMFPTVSAPRLRRLSEVRDTHAPDQFMGVLGLLFRGAKYGTPMLRTSSWVSSAYSFGRKLGVLHSRPPALSPVADSGSSAALRDRGRIGSGGGVAVGGVPGGVSRGHSGWCARFGPVVRWLQRAVLREVIEDGADRGPEPQSAELRWSRAPPLWWRSSPTCLIPRKRS